MPLDDESCFAFVGGSADILYSSDYPNSVMVSVQSQPLPRGEEERTMRQQALEFLLEGRLTSAQVGAWVASSKLRD